MITLKKQHRGYEHYRQSGADWIGDIPDEWKLESLKKAAPFVSRGNSPDYNDTDEGIPVINQACIYWDGIDVEKIKYQQTVDFSTFKGKLEGGDVLVNSTGTGTLGRVAIYDSTKIPGAIADGHVTIVRTDDSKLHNGYLAHLLSTPLYQGYIYAAIVNGSTNQIELSKEGLRRMPVILPDIHAQSSIASYLDEKCAIIDRIIEGKKKQMEILQEQRVAIINQAVTKGLDEKVEMKESGVEWFGKIPKNWEVKKLKFVATLQSGEAITSESIEAVGDFAVYGGNGLRGYCSNYTHEGDYILIGRQGALCGNINYAHGKFWASEHAVVATIIDESDFRWLGEVLRMMDLGQYSISSAQPGLAAEKISKLEIPVPPTAEQILVAEYIVINSKEIDRRIQIVEQSISLLNEYKTSLISHVVTGKVKVS